ncbi:MAG: D-glycero-alpha-D-manno-heptose-1,7-bisphosphate 7-phosphatase [Saprospiraceae bacterium]
MNTTEKNNWTLFLDRDGVINERLPGAYIADWRDFQFTAKAIDAIARCRSYFRRIVIVTNQQGIGKGIMSFDELSNLHQAMLEEIQAGGGQIDGIYTCPDLASTNSVNRKPNPGMAYQAQKDFPEINFKRSVMVGDSISDIQFGKRLGMYTVLIPSKMEEADLWEAAPIDYRFDNLKLMADYLEEGGIILKKNT